MNKNHVEFLQKNKHQAQDDDCKSKHPSHDMEDICRRYLNLPNTINPPTTIQLTFTNGLKSNTEATYSSGHLFHHAIKRELNVLY